MYRLSLNKRLVIAALPGFVGGSVLGLLLTAGSYPRNHQLEFANSAQDTRSVSHIYPDIIKGVDERVISTICSVNDPPSQDGADQQMHEGIDNAQRLLPETRQFLMEFFHEM